MNPSSRLVKDKDKVIIKIGEITDTFKFPRVMLDHSQVYVWDKFLCKVNIYSKDNMKKVAQFGGKGEGPGEFRVINSAYINDNYIYINSYPKLCIFSKDGKFMKESRSAFEIGSFIPIGNNFIGKKHPFTSPAHNSKIIYVLLDSNLKKIKELFETEYMREVTDISPSKMEVLWFRDCYRGVVYKDRFYVASTERGFFFSARKTGTVRENDQKF
jgi:hypothetical protein